MKSCGLLIICLLAPAHPASTIEPPMLVKESAGTPPAGAPSGCSLDPNLTGDCGNLSYYNLCAGYIWIYASGPASIGVRFDDPCVSSGNTIDKAITYWRNVVPNYGRTVDIFVDGDVENDGCPNFVLASHPALDPALRWNCSPFGNLCIPSGVEALIVRAQTHGSFPTFATDGPSYPCDPEGSDHSYYYGTAGQVCVPFRNLGETGRGDNLLFWLIVDNGCLTATEPSTWGHIKGLYR